MRPFGRLAKALLALLPKHDMAAEFDIEGMPVVSVERQRDGMTVICYGRDLKEWHAYTTDEVHRGFCERLKRKLQDSQK